MILLLKMIKHFSNNKYFLEIYYMTIIASKIPAACISRHFRGIYYDLIMYIVWILACNSRHFWGIYYFYKKGVITHSACISRHFFGYIIMRHWQLKRVKPATAGIFFLGGGYIMGVGLFSCAR